MLAAHPITGKQIRILTTDASLWKENKTLCYGESPIWDTVWEKGSPTYRIVMEPIPLDELKLVSCSSQLLLASAEAAAGITPQILKENGIQNLIILNTFHLAYPHIGGEWDGTVVDAVIMISALLRYRRVYGAWNSRGEQLGLVKEDAAPFRIWWLTQFYTPEKAKRQREINKCLHMNFGSKYIDRVVLLNERHEEFAVYGSEEDYAKKVKETVIHKRLTYADVFKRASEFPDDVVLVFANADICIDDVSWKHLWSLNLENKFLALLRYDVPENGVYEEAKIFGPRADSQDTWVVRVKDIKERGLGKDEEFLKAVSFPFGQMGCDNAISLEMLRKKFLVVNPAVSLKTYHLHTSNIRTYAVNNVVDKPVFLYVNPSGLNDLEPVLKWDSTVVSTKPEVIKRVLRGPGASFWSKIVGSPSSSDSSKNWKMNTENLLTPAEEHIIRADNCFQSPDGLMFTSKKLFIGSSEVAQKKWSPTVYALTPSLASDKCLVSEWPKGAANCRATYCVRFLSKIIRLWNTPDGHGGEFFCPEKDVFTEMLELFNWNVPSLPILKHESDILVWGKKAIGFAIGDSNVLKEDIAALRGFIKGWQEAPVANEQGKYKIVVIEDLFTMTTDLVRCLEAKLGVEWDVHVAFNDTTASRFQEIMCGAWGVICGTAMKHVGWNWLLPKGAYVLEVNSINAEGIELSTASSLEHRFVSMGGLSGVERTVPILKELGEERELWNSLRGDPNIPVVWVPRRDIEGYFGHPGDSFREMLRLWARAGYVRVCEHPTAVMIWWGSVGPDGVLLYDRPNNDWRVAAPLAEREFKMALFGNPKPPSNSNPTKSWFFWPRRPELVEKIHSEGKHLDGWWRRLKNLVFYGKVENNVQKKRRSNADWSSCCDDWFMAASDKEPYRFTQEEYLRNLAGARYGLCLAGYGYKCHREVECMAMGCVPIVAPDVDMSNYANPPQEGVHYIRVANPDEAKAYVDAATEESWKTMSAACLSWWKENVSVEGSFNLTKSLVEKVEV
jgi:hypothetical protein